MPCETVNFPGGSGIICTRGRRPGPCEHPGCTRAHTVRCDWPVKRLRRRGLGFAVEVQGTCSRRCCREHSKHVGKDKDFCLEHAQIGERRAPELPGLK